MNNQNQKSAALQLLNALKTRSVDFFFANPGTDFPSIVEAFSDVNLTNSGNTVPRPILVTHENAAVSMAHGATLVNGRAQAVMVHTNVGTGNTVNGLTNAARDRVPMIVMAGKSPITQDGMHGSRSFPIHWAQEMFDQAGIVRELVKWEYELHFPEQVEEVVDRALDIATAAPQGPVYLTLPREVLAMPGASASKSRSAPKPAALHPDPSDIECLVQWFAKAKSPLIITSNIGRTREGFEALDEFATRYAVSVACVSQRYLAMRTNHPMHEGTVSSECVKDADLIIALECDVPWIPGNTILGPHTKVVHVGEDPLFARYPMRQFPSDLNITAKSAVTLRLLEAALAASQSVDSDAVAKRRQIITERSNARRQRHLDEIAASKNADVITPPLMAACLSEALDGDAIVFNEYSLRFDYFERAHYGSYFGLPAPGGLGWGFGAALGAKLAAPDRLVVSVLGDGAYVFNNPSACHWVSAAHELPLLVIVINNGRYGAVRRATAEMYHNGSSAKDDWSMLADLEPSPAFEKYAEASGGYGERVERPEDLPAALERAIAVVKTEGRQALLNVICKY
jgi:acetolactate synthase-1/2/3 large subunit